MGSTVVAMKARNIKKGDVIFLLNLGEAYKVLEPTTMLNKIDIWCKDRHDKDQYFIFKAEDELLVARKGVIL
jgi:hypothetical protein